MLLKRIAILATCTLVVPGVAAQDSTALPTSPQPGDALSPWTATEQCNEYVVDLTSFTTDWGTTFGIAPVLKSTNVQPGVFYNNIFNSQAASAEIQTDVAYPHQTYDLWTAQTEGINGNPALNAAPSQSASPLGVSNQIWIGAAEVAFDNNIPPGNYEGIITASINWNENDPTRLYVGRVQSAVSGPSFTNYNANFGFGAIDSDGNTYIRADQFNLTGGDQISGNNIFRIDSPARDCNVVNTIGGIGCADGAVCDWLVQFSGNTYNSPSCIPATIASRPIYIGGNFNDEYAYESAANVVTTTQTHLGGVPGQRGNVSYSKADANPGSGCVGTAALLAKDAVNNNTDRILLWGVGANGAPCGTSKVLDPPDPIVDQSNGFSWPSAGAIGEFHHHVSQVSFDGGNGQVAVGTDLSGNIVLATPIQVGGPDNANPNGGILAARFDPNNYPASLEWTMVAYNDPAGGKDILDGPSGSGGTSIGTITTLSAVTGGAVTGPSFSLPTIDAAGNVWFIAAVELDLGGGMTDLDSALCRAVLDPNNNGTFAYEIEKVVELGDRFMGQNSATEYQVTFMGIADSNSVSSGTMFSGNMVQCACNDLTVDDTLVTSADARNLGGLVINIEITYDVNGDGMFDGGLGTMDQEYNVVAFIGATDCPEPTPPVFTYCTAKPSDAGGCLGSIGSSPGQPTSGANDWSVTVSQIDGAKTGIFFTSTSAQAAIPFQGGTLCFFPPLKRSLIEFSFGTNGMCNGAYDLIVNDGAIIPSGFDAGSGNTSFIQAWWRSPCGGCNTGFDSGLSNALSVDWL